MLEIIATLAVQQDPAADLRAAVLEPDPAARRAAADDLAQLDVTVDRWLEIMREFGSFERLERGQHVWTVPLWNGTELEPTEVHVHVPRKYSPRLPAPLMLVAHGTGGSGRGQTRLFETAAESLGMVVIAPSESGPNDGYRYSERERQITLAAIRAARLRCNIDENRIFLSGISRGGHLTWDVATRFPDRFAALAPMIGGPRWNPGDGQNNLRYVENIAHVAMRDLQGSHDHPLLLFNLRLAFERLRQAGARDAELIEFPEMGHSFRMDAVEWSAFLGGATREALPSRVVRLAARPSEGRAAWVEVLRTTSKVKDGFRIQVAAKAWNSMDDGQRRRHVQSQADDLTARIEAELVQPGRIRVKTKHVASFRLLISRDMLDDDQKLVLERGGRKRRLAPKPSPKVLLREFVERFDRTFLPIAEVRSR